MNPDNSSQLLVLRFGLVLMIWLALFAFAYTLGQDGVPSLIHVTLALLSSGMLVLAFLVDRRFRKLQCEVLGKQTFLGFYRSEQVFELFHQHRLLQAQRAERRSRLEEAGASGAPPTLLDRISSSIDEVEAEIGALQVRLRVALEDTIPRNLPRGSEGYVRQLFKSELELMEKPSA